MHGCRVGVAFGEEASELYSFPQGHPMNKARTKIFFENLKKLRNSNEFSFVLPTMALEKDLVVFHEQAYVEHVKRSSAKGMGYLDYGDTPSFPGVYEASLYPVGGTLEGLKLILAGSVDHFFNPVGGLHHARRDRAGGFCVFNDAAIAILKCLALDKFRRVAYVDIDAHHGDGVYYGFESDPRVIIGDIHEDGRFLYPGTGSSSETGSGEGKGTKINIPLPPGSRDEEFQKSFDKLEKFLREFAFDFIFLQCGADGLEGCPITHLAYSSRAHGYATERLHELAHEVCGGRILAMGGGGYNPQNVNRAWSAVLYGLKESGEGRGSK